MAFSSPVFLFYFMPLFFALYFAAPKFLRNPLVLFSSLLFYAWGEPAFVFFLVASCALDYYFCRFFFDENSPRSKKICCTFLILTNAAGLVYYKYIGFFVRQLLPFLPAGTDQSWALDIALPAGISFFTFHKISYIVDLYRGTSRTKCTFAEYLIYICNFPQLVAGPIVRYHEIARDLKERLVTGKHVEEGLQRFIIGFSKKILIADPLSLVPLHLFGPGVEQIATPLAWYGAFCYALQIYFDFSGYSDMAIGLARMMGFRFPENFNYPYRAVSITDFWRRWHISLSSWMREYLYIPLGGNRVPVWRQYINLWIVFLFSGIWHGANWTFVIWGAYHGALLTLDRAGQPWIKVMHRPFVTFILVTIGWVLFRADTLDQALQYFRSMFVWSLQTDAQVPLEKILSFKLLVLFVGSMIFLFLPAAWLEGAQSWIGRRFVAGENWGRALHFSLFVFALIMLLGSSYHPFIYFRF